MRSDELDYELPAELIAQHPAARRDASRLLVYDRATGAVRHRTFAELPAELAPEELLVVNDIVRRLTLDKADAGTIRNAAMEAGMVVLRFDGARKVVQGMTTPEEVMLMTAESSD